MVVKKVITLIMVNIVSLLFLVSCQKGQFVLSILEVNDLHGYIEQDSKGKEGISNLAYKIQTIRNETELDDVVLVANGDMFQGTGVSNITRGKAVIDCMNMLDFDAMGIGNHEFDWELSEIYKFFDKDESNGEANFPLLNGNVYRKDTNELELSDNVLEYVITEKKGVKIAILSYVGDIRSSIAVERCDEYYFDTDIAERVEEVAKPLKESGAADIVLVNIHDGDVEGANEYSENKKLANLKYKDGWLVDAVINGHTHTKYADYIKRDGVDLPVVQGKSYNNYLGRIDLGIDLNSKKVLSADSKTVANDSNRYEKEVQDTLDEAVAAIDNEQFCTLGDTVKYKDQLEKWHGYTAIQALGADVFVSNTGGIRSTGDIVKGKTIDLFNVYEISPFDNDIFLIKTTKAKMKFLINSDSVFYVTKHNMTLEEDKEYTFAVISYVYYWSQLDTVRSDADVNTGYVIRDLLIEDLRYRRDNELPFNPVNNPNSVLSKLID